MTHSSPQLQSRFSNRSLGSVGILVWHILPQTVPNPRYTMIFYIYIPRIKFDVYIGHNKRLTTTIYNKIE